VRHGGTIPVILLDEVLNKGSKGDVVKVKRGFARNFLIPRKLAAYATDDNKVLYSAYTEAAAKRKREEEELMESSSNSGSSGSGSSSSQAKENKEAIRKYLQELDEQPPRLTFDRAIIPNTRSLFGSVSSGDIADEIGKAYPLLPSPPLASHVEMSAAVGGSAIKALGMFEVSVAGVNVLVNVRASGEGVAIEEAKKP